VPAAASAARFYSDDFDDFDALVAEQFIEPN
jgi:hypothetical protein